MKSSIKSLLAAGAACGMVFAGAAAPAAPPAKPAVTTEANVIGRLAVVTAARGEIRRSREKGARVLSAVPGGTYLGITASAGDDYPVRMVDGSTGWIAKSQVRVSEDNIALAASSYYKIAPPTPGYGIPPAPDERTQALLRAALLPAGTANPTRGDSSRFVQQVFASQGVGLPRRTRDQMRAGTTIPWSDLRPGDRLFFGDPNDDALRLTGIYLGNGRFVYASRRARRVIVDSLVKRDFYDRLVAIRRSEPRASE